VSLVAFALPVAVPHVGRAFLTLPVFSRLRGRPDYQAVLKRREGTLASQRAQVVEMLCGPTRISPTWRPAPETSADTNPAR
jgi:hypothetical protein